MCPKTSGACSWEYGDLRQRFWVGLVVGAIGTVTTLVTTAELHHRAEQRALRRAARWHAPNYGESEFR